MSDKRSLLILLPLVGGRHARPYITQAEVSIYLFAQWKPVDNDPMQCVSTSKKVTKLLRESNVIPNVSVCCNDLRKNMSTQMIEKYGNDSTRVIAGAKWHIRRVLQKNITAAIT